MVTGSSAPPPSEATAVVHKNSAFPPDHLQHLVTLVNSFFWGGGWGSRAWREAGGSWRQGSDSAPESKVCAFLWSGVRQQ